MTALEVDHAEEAQAAKQSERGSECPFRGRLRTAREKPRRVRARDRCRTRATVAQDVDRTAGGIAVRTDDAAGEECIDGIARLVPVARNAVLEEGSVFQTELNDFIVVGGEIDTQIPGEPAGLEQ